MVKRTCLRFFFCLVLLSMIHMATKVVITEIRFLAEQLKNLIFSSFNLSSAFK
jgi:hypothetical protein